MFAVYVRWANCNSDPPPNIHTLAVLDYTFDPPSRTISFRETPLLCDEVMIMEDTIVEADEFFNVTLSSSDRIDLEGGPARVVIRDDDSMFQGYAWEEGDHRNSIQFSYAKNSVKVQRAFVRLTTEKIYQISLAMTVQIIRAFR